MIFESAFILQRRGSSIEEPDRISKAFRPQILFLSLKICFDVIIFRPESTYCSCNAAKKARFSNIGISTYQQGARIRIDCW